MTYFIAGVLCALGSVWLGFYLARLAPDAKPATPSAPESFGGEVLDFAVYPQEVVDE